MRHYRLSADVHLELFDEEAILFVASRDLMVTTNRAAAELYDTIRSALAGRPFTRAECADLLLQTYQLSPQEAQREAAAMLAFGLRNRIVQKELIH